MSRPVAGLEHTPDAPEPDPPSCRHHPVTIAGFEACYPHEPETDRDIRRAQIAAQCCDHPRSTRT